MQRKLNTISLFNDRKIKHYFTIQCKENKHYFHYLIIGKLNTISQFNARKIKHHFHYSMQEHYFTI